MSAHSIQHRRAIVAMNNRSSKVPSSVHVLNPRFSPTASFTDDPLFPVNTPDPKPNPTPNPEPTPVPVPDPNPAPVESPKPDQPVHTIPVGNIPPTALSSPPLNTQTSTTSVLAPSSDTSTTSSAPTSPPTTSSTPTPTPTPSPTKPVDTPQVSLSKSLVQSSSTPRTTAPSVTLPLSVQGSATSAAASSTPTIGTSGSINTGAVVGGIAGGLVAIAAVILLISFLMRRARKHRDEKAFNAIDFRRSAVLMDEPPTHEDTVTHGFNPRAPAMIEQRLASPAPTFGTQYGAPPSFGYNSNNHSYNHGGYNDTPTEYGYGPGPTHAQYASYSPGQVITDFSVPPSGINPMFTPTPYNQSPFSPMASPSSTAGGPYESAYNEKGGFTSNQSLNRQPSVITTPNGQHTTDVNAAQLSRQPSTAAMVIYPSAHQTSQGIENSPVPNQYPNHPGFPNESVHYSAPYPANDYVDLDRSSVTPFQAAQYAEISRRLNTNVPVGLDSSSSGSQVRKMDIVDEDEEKSLASATPHNGIAVSPFADPSSAPPSPKGGPTSERSVSGLTESGVHEFNFPTPPSPSVSTSSRFRIDSTPPMLPEIHLQDRESVPYDFPNSVRGSSSPSSGIYSDNGYMPRTPIAPSPLASSFAMPTSTTESHAPGAYKETTLTPNVQSAAGSEGTVVQRGNVSEVKRPDTVYTLYDPEDAYGGI